MRVKVEASRAGAGVIFRNINIEDPRPTLQQFFICITMPKPYSKDGGKGAAKVWASSSNTLFTDSSSCYTTSRV